MAPKKRCGKKRYATLADAREGILELADKYAIVYKKAYRCAACAAWHITSTPPPRGRRIQR